MLKKIYSELVAIKKELQVIKYRLEPKTITINEMTTVETQMITGERLMTVSFQLNYRDWCKLSKKKYWMKVRKFLSEKENKNTQT